MTRSIHRRAAKELADAVRFYELEAGVGIARRFLNEFERIARLAEEFPDIGTPSGDGRRWIPLNGFPFVVLYRFQAGALRILVVRHQRRDPDHGDSRR